MRFVPLAVAFAVVATAPEAEAHERVPVGPQGWWTAWTLDPLVLVGLLAAAVLYRSGVQRAGGTGRLRSASFAAGLVVVVLALISPLHEVAEDLFAVHMVQHLLLIAVAPPLLLAGVPIPLWSRGLPSWGRTGVGLLARRFHPLRRPLRALSDPFVAWPAHVGVVWAWHLPGLYEAALRSTLVHAAEHASMLVTAILFWVPVFGVRRRRMAAGVVVLYLFAMAVVGTILGALMAFSPRPWYTVHDAGAAAWGLTSLQDQQLAGLIMWMPGGMVYAGAAVWVLAAWLRAPERRDIAARSL